MSLSRKSVKIGMAQLLVEGGEPERNLARAEKMIKDAACKGCQIVLLPEVLDLAWTHPSAKTEAQPIPGPYSQRLCAAAKEYGIYVCAGLTEKQKEKVYNTAVFIDKEGDILLKYHKINLLDVEQPFYAVGQSLSVIETPFGLIGINICADNYYDSLHIGHALARMGAQIILSPSSWTVDYSIDETKDPYREKWIGPYSILAKLYNIVIVGTTSVGYIVGGPYEGKKMVGCSIAVNKDGVIARGPYLEFAGELIDIDIEIPQRKEKGTEIGVMLGKKGYRFEDLKDLRDI
ncbi:MAG: carbon-nitrogen hydrolase family protein [Candidatus Omnitrophota bacterium]|nr:carbon-nitrogen hydrolase family protein [Candidatus Omnitrophota bacterium]